MNDNYKDYFKFRKYSKRLQNGGLSYLLKNWKDHTNYFKDNEVFYVDDFLNSLTTREIIWETTFLNKDDQYQSFIREVKKIDEEIKKNTTFQELPLISSNELEYPLNGQLEKALLSINEHWWYYGWPTYALNKGLIPENMVSPPISIF